MTAAESQSPNKLRAANMDLGQKIDITKDDAPEQEFTSRTSQNVNCVSVAYNRPPNFVSGQLRVLPWEKSGQNSSRAHHRPTAEHHRRVENPSSTLCDGGETSSYEPADRRGSSSIGYETSKVDRYGAATPDAMKKLKSGAHGPAQSAVRHDVSLTIAPSRKSTLGDRIESFRRSPISGESTANSFLESTPASIAKRHLDRLRRGSKLNEDNSAALKAVRRQTAAASLEDQTDTINTDDAAMNETFSQPAVPCSETGMSATLQSVAVSKVNAPWSIAPNYISKAGPGSGIHRTWVAAFTRTAKCDKCEKNSRDVLQCCQTCSKQLCQNCIEPFLNNNNQHKAPVGGFVWNGKRKAATNNDNDARSAKKRIVMHLDDVDDEDSRKPGRGNSISKSVPPSVESGLHLDLAIDRSKPEYRMLKPTPRRKGSAGPSTTRQDEARFDNQTSRGFAPISFRPARDQATSPAAQEQSPSQATQAHGFAQPPPASSPTPADLHECRTLGDVIKMLHECSTIGFTDDEKVHLEHIRGEAWDRDPTLKRVREESQGHAAASLLNDASLIFEANLLLEKLKNIRSE